MKKRKIPKEFLGAFKQGHRRPVREFIDEKLASRLLKKTKAGDKEAKSALEWLTKFNNEYHKAVIKKGDEKAFHNTDELRKDCNKRSYANKVDFYSRFNKTKKGENL